MTRFALLLVLLPALAFGQAQSKNCSSASSKCKVNTLTTTGAVQLGGSLTLGGPDTIVNLAEAFGTPGLPLILLTQNSNGSDGLQVNTGSTYSAGNLVNILNNGTPEYTFRYDGFLTVNNGLAVSSLVAANTTGTFNITTATSDGSSAVGFTLNTNNSLANASAKLVSFQNGSSEKASIDATGNVKAGGGSNPVPVVHSGQTTSPVAVEYGRSASTSGGVLAVTFSNAFGSAPVCTCVDNNAAPVSCGISTASSTTAVTFTIGSARVDSVSWQCFGAK